MFGKIKNLLVSKLLPFAVPALKNVGAVAVGSLLPLVVQSAQSGAFGPKAQIVVGALLALGLLHVTPPVYKAPEQK